MENTSWLPPKYPYVKLTVDGSWLPHNQMMGIGGVIRDSTRSWRRGFAHSF
uniref:RNase H type-1 domain-containing protein n=1 Tax=Cajanus cajan TaxID=3821 RepID=A0A151TEE4_CAJCA|nr:hypothetical protein KK1_011630 [Cajanus cajan]